MTFKLKYSSHPESKYRRFTPTNPRVTYAFIGVTLIVFLAQVITENFFGDDYPLLYGAKYGPAIYYGRQYWRLITPIFLHAGLQHFLVNMYSLFVLGMTVEKLWGHRDFFLFYLITGFAGNTFSYICNFNSVSVGASTAIYGLLAAYLFFILKNRAFMPNFAHQLRSILLTIGVNFLISLRGNIDLWGHIGGFIGGVLICLFAAPTLKRMPLRLDMGDHPAGDLTASGTDDASYPPSVMVDMISTLRRLMTFALVTLVFILLAAYFDRYDYLIAPLIYR